MLQLAHPEHLFNTTTTTTKQNIKSLNNIVKKYFQKYYNADQTIKSKTNIFKNSNFMVRNRDFYSTVLNFTSPKS